jgi:hypothetical protein
MYYFFFHLPRKSFEFPKLCDVFVEKGDKLFTNVKTKRISMLFLLKCVME